MKDHTNHSATIREWLVLQVAPDQRRLDRYLHPLLPELSRSALQELFSTGKIRLNGRVAAKGDRIKIGDRIAANLPVGLESPPPADPSVPFAVLYEDRDILIVDKPGLIPTQPLRPWERGTLANGLVTRFPELRGAGPDPLEAGLVHRLDTGTSGLLVAARTPESHARLKQDLARRRWEKRYLALVRGEILAEEIITAPLAHDSGDRKRMVIVSAEDPREQRRGRIYRAETRVRPREHYPSATLVEVQLVTGVTHQIRVHLAGRGHPVVGDYSYGPADSPCFELPGGRYFLHAFQLVLPHPVTRDKLICTSPLPEDLREVLVQAGRL
jgi:23S rRNA pseudouridine1911/1915/1917 synthase